MSNYPVKRILVVFSLVAPIVPLGLTALVLSALGGASLSAGLLNLLGSIALFFACLGMACGGLISLIKPGVLMRTVLVPMTICGLVGGIFILCFNSFYLGKPDVAYDVTVGGLVSALQGMIAWIIVCLSHKN